MPLLRPSLLPGFQRRLLAAMNNPDARADEIGQVTIEHGETCEFEETSLA